MRRNDEEDGKKKKKNEKKTVFDTLVYVTISSSMRARDSRCILRARKGKIPRADVNQPVYSFLASSKYGFSFGASMISIS